MNTLLLREIGQKLAMELAFAQAGKDDGLLPINSLLTELEEPVGDPACPALLRDGIALARSWVDRSLEAGQLSADDLERFSAWTTWLQTTADAASAGRPLSPPPVTVKANAPNGAPDGSRSLDPGSETVCLDLEQNQELLREFSAEAREHLQEIELGVLALEDKPEDAHTLNAVFRGFHSLKGGSGFLALTPVNRLAHELESLLDLARQHKLRINSDHIDLILCGADALKRFMVSVDRQLTGEEPAGPIQLPIAELLARIVQTLEGEEAPTDPPGREPGNQAVVPAPAEPAAASTAGPPRDRAGLNGSVKVDTAKLDSLVDLVGEMVIAQAQVTQDPALAQVQSQQLARNLAQLRRITNDLQRTSMSLRMVPIRGTFQKMTRLVRDLSAKAGKLVELRLSGEDTELDRNIIEEISDPLVHMIRNAVDHGIEKPEVRVAAGKAARGEIRLRAFHEGGNVVIEVRDDGAGLNAERILAKAIARGLVPQGHSLTEPEIFALIFAAGFSTAETVTDISGRGVGMDVVRRNIDKLRGKIDIASEAGRGSTFSIYLPLTLAIIDGLLVSVGRERFILPTLSVRESFRPTPEMMSCVQGRAEMVNVRGQIRPLLRLHEYFGLEAETREPTAGIVMVVESEGLNRCLLVDRLLGKQEVVIKGLGDAFKRSRGLTGAAILGDGRVALILDVNALVRLKTNETPEEGANRMADLAGQK